MKVNLLFFASLRETLGVAAEVAEPSAEVTTVGALREHLAARGGAWEALRTTKNLRAAVNQQMVSADASVADGDEVAFFPPVTGG